jgi:hypothetical protein
MSNICASLGDNKPLVTYLCDIRHYNTELMKSMLDNIKAHQQHVCGLLDRSKFAYISTDRILQGSHLLNRPRWVGACSQSMSDIVILRQVLTHHFKTLRDVLRPRVPMLIHEEPKSSEYSQVMKESIRELSTQATRSLIRVTRGNTVGARVLEQVLAERRAHLCVSQPVSSILSSKADVQTRDKLLVMHLVGSHIGSSLQSDIADIISDTLNDGLQSDTLGQSQDYEGAVLHMVSLRDNSELVHRLMQANLW